MLLDIDYILLGLPGLALSLWAQVRISSAFGAAFRNQGSSGLSGAETAERILLAGGASGVEVEPAGGQAGDHFDMLHKVLGVSGWAYSDRSLGAVGIAAHEAGHAIQEASRYHGLMVRNVIVPVAGVVSTTFSI